MRKLHIAVLLLLALATSCFKDPNFEPGGGESGAQPQPGRLPTQEVRNVMVMYSAGFNSLSGDLSEDLEELATDGFVPTAQSRADNILLVFSRHTDGSYSSPVAPVLYRLYKDKEGTVVKDTLLRWGEKTQATDPAVLTEVLTFARDKFPAKGYGLVYSSHASGWLPDPDRTKVSLKSVGQDADTGRLHETNLDEFVDALPYPLDYVLFDACFMACVEVAWELREKAPLVGFSPTEIVSDGFNYKTLAQRLIGSDEPDVQAVCEDYFVQYSSKPKESDRNATITLVDTRELEPLVTLCRTLFETYRAPIAALTSSQVQKYYRPGHNYRHEHLFDLRDMLDKAGISASEMADLDAALGACILYEQHTPSFLGLPLVNVCGLSVFLPSTGDDTLKDFYRQHVSWNTETELIKYKLSYRDPLGSSVSPEIHSLRSV